MSKIVSVAAYPLSLPLKEPFTTAKGRAYVSRSVIMKITLDSGICGLGEATPVKYVTGETTCTVVPAISTARPLLIGADPADWQEVGQRLEQALPEAHSARAGLEMSLLDAAARERGVPLYSYLDGKASPVVTDETVCVVSPKEAGNFAREAWANGVRRFKIKVNGEADDIPRVRAIAEVAPQADIKVDANQAFSAGEAIDFVESLEAHGIVLSLLEQPVVKDDIEGLRHVTRNVSVPVFADESALDPEHVRRLIEAGAVNGVNIKLMKSGVRGALQIIDMCRKSGISLMIGCMLESKIGLSCALHLACATGAFEHFDLDSDQLISRQPVVGGFERRGDELEVTEGPGLGCLLSAGRMELAWASLTGCLLSRG